jgi:hypothetical protein
MVTALTSTTPLADVEMTAPTRLDVEPLVRGDDDDHPLRQLPGPYSVPVAPPGYRPARR